MVLLEGNMAKYVTFLILLLGSLTKANAQQFYVSASPFGTPDNKTYKLHIDSCGTFTDSTNLPIFTCHSSGHINDIAIDKDNTLWYITDTIINKTIYSALTKRKLSDSNCQFVAQFPFSSMNSLVADTIGNIYITGGYGGGWLYKYDGNNLSVIDSLPKHMAPAGDLFFYNNRLFVTCNSSSLDTAYIAEYNFNDPGQACYYMPLGKMQPYSAFTIHKEAASDRVFILDVHTPNYDKTSLIEIDIPNKKILNTLCTYPIVARGAASRYPAVWDSTSCPPPSGISSHTKVSDDLRIYNPANDRIVVKTSVESSEIVHVDLFSLSGMKIKSYTKSEFPNNLDISAIPIGLYILQVKINTGQVWNKKVLKN